MRRLLKYLKPFWKMVVLVVSLIFAECITQLLLPNLMAKIVDLGIAKGDFNFIIKTGMVMISITLLEIVITLSIAYFSSKVAIGVGNTLRRKMFNHTTDFALYEIDKVGTSSAITRITNDITQVQTTMFMILRLILMAPMMCIGGIVMAVRTDLYLSRVLMVSLPLLILTIAVIGKIAMPTFGIMQTKIDKVNQVMREKLTGIRVIRAFNKDKYEENRFDVANTNLRDVSMKVQLIMAVMLPLIMFIMNITTVAIVWFSSYRVDIGAMQVGNITAFIEYSTIILTSLTMMAIIFVMLPRAITCAKRIDEVLETDLSIKDGDNDMTIKTGEIVFNNVACKYYGSENNAVENISFTVKPGTVTAIVGGTGSGKSTILNLLMRFYDANEGEVLIDGVNIKDIKQKNLRDAIGYVPQKAMLFSGSIKENIKFGRQDATDEEIIKVLETAQAMEFVSKMPKGIDEYIAQGGTNVSGGQKQRLSIARALIKDAKIYVFDDSFSALDFKTDYNLRKALEPTFANSTVIIVAQRISTIKNADNILMLEDGKIIGSGTHEYLMENCVEYAEIANSQMQEGVI